MSFRLILAAGAALAVASVPALSTTTRSAPPPGVPCATLQAGTHRLPAIAGRVPVVLHVARGMRPGGSLVLALPGAGQTARDFARDTGFTRLSDRKGFAVAYPTAAGTRPFWNISGVVAGKPDDVAYLRKVIAAAVQAACADPRRVGVTGVSNGGGMAARLACDASDLVAAAAPVAGGYKSLPDCQPSNPVAMLEIHGTSDHVVPYRGSGPQRSGDVSAFVTQWRRLDGCAGRASRRSIEPGKPALRVTELRWTGCARGSAVIHDRVVEAEHGWPGEDDYLGRHEFSATLRTWRFLTAF